MQRLIYRLRRLAIYKVGLNVKAMEAVGIPGMLQHIGFGVCKRNEPDLVFSITRKGPTHFGSSFLEASVHGLCNSTKSLGSMLFCFTFLSCWALISF
jgi:hypothetical protein